MSFSTRKSLASTSSDSIEEVSKTTTIAGHLGSLSTEIISISLLRSFNRQGDEVTQSDINESNKLMSRTGESIFKLDMLTQAKING